MSRKLINNQELNRFVTCFHFDFQSFHFISFFSIDFFSPFSISSDLTFSLHFTVSLNLQRIPFEARKSYKNCRTWNKNSDVKFLLKNQDVSIFTLMILLVGNFFHLLSFSLRSKTVQSQTFSNIGSCREKEEKLRREREEKL